MSLSRDPRHSTDSVLYHSSASSSREKWHFIVVPAQSPQQPTHPVCPGFTHCTLQGGLAVYLPTSVWTYSTKEGHSSPTLPARVGPALVPAACDQPKKSRWSLQPGASPESQVKVRAESSVNMMATACLLVSLGSRVTHLTLLISVTWRDIPRDLARPGHFTLHLHHSRVPQEGTLRPQDSVSESSLLTGWGI